MLNSTFLQYLVDKEIAPGQRLPALNEISQELGVSVGKLREELEVARNMGIVSVRPRLGIQREPFDFSRVLLDGVQFSLATGDAEFENYSRLRQVVEAGFWDQAVLLLTTEDLDYLQELVNRAWNRLRGEPIHIPNREHREFHLTIFSRLNNPFVQGILIAYWKAYESSELTRFASYPYWIEVWTYHERIVDALYSNEFSLGRHLLEEHFSLLKSLPTTAVESPHLSGQSFLASKGEIK
ncbi:MAG: FCD domain-containing protein [Candidatus Promineifilaceae bacterium]|nr:FCD domain-containing protein [Candidatus Promineifilaceae bacterium]